MNKMVHFTFMLAAPSAVMAFALLGGDRNSLRPTSLSRRQKGSESSNYHRLPRQYSHSHIVSPYAATPLRKIRKKNQPLSEDLLAAHNEFSKDTNQNEMSTSQLHDLCELLGASPPENLRLESAEEDGVRGIYTGSMVSAWGIILQIPLESCLLDDEPPNWYLRSKEEGQLDGEDAALSSFAYTNPSHWATRLAAPVVDLQLKQRAAGDVDVDDSSITQKNSKIAQGKMRWLSFLPNSDYLRASLPVHWSEDVLRSARCTALELAVDSSYFARAEAVADLMLGLQNLCPDAKGISSEELTQLCQNALDVVQTRSCRAERSDMEEEGFPLRVLAPVFDLINHGSSQGRGEGAANARFGVEDHKNDKGVSRPFLCVRATKDVGANEEVLISYGDSAKPSWKCLLSYGFVPRYNTNDEDDEGGEDEHDDDENVAEIFLDGNRYEVGPTTVPFELVAAATPPEIIEKRKEVVLTPDIAIKLAKRISAVSFYLLVDDEKRSRKNGNEDDDADADDDLDFIESAEDLTSWQLAASLRWSQHHILRACAKGLQEWANQ